MIDSHGCDSEQDSGRTQAEARQRLRALMQQMLQLISALEAEAGRGINTWLTLESYAAEVETSLEVLTRRIAGGSPRDGLKQAATIDDEGADRRRNVDDWPRIVQQAIDQLHVLKSPLNTVAVHEAEAPAADPPPNQLTAGA